MLVACLPVGRTTIDTEDIAVEGKRLQQLGFDPQFDLHAGWREVLFEEDNRRRMPDA